MLLNTFFPDYILRWNSSLVSQPIIRVCVCVCVCTCMSIYMYMHMTCMFAGLHKYKSADKLTWVCVPVRVCACAQIHTHTHIHTQTTCISRNTQLNTDKKGTLLAYKTQLTVQGMSTRARKKSLCVKRRCVAVHLAATAAQATKSDWQHKLCKTHLIPVATHQAALATLPPSPSPSR